MKHAILLSFLFCVVMIAGAQTEKGNILVGGSLTASRSTQTFSSVDYTSTSFGLGPSVSYFVADRFAAGLIASYSYSTTSSESAAGPTNSHSQAVGFGPTARYYFPLGEKTWLFPEMDYLWSWNHTQTETNGAVGLDNKANSQTFRGGAGVAYFIAKNVGVEGLIYYQNLNSDNPSASTTTSTNGIYLRIGLQIYILRSP